MTFVMTTIINLNTVTTNTVNPIIQIATYISIFIKID